LSPLILTSAVRSARAADEWFVLSEQTIKSVDQGVEMKSEGGRWKTKVKQIKVSVEGAALPSPSGNGGFNERSLHQRRIACNER
jgi:hypothetical protein